MEPPAAHSEREWILLGMAQCCVERGYEGTSVTDVCAAAGVSRESFEWAFAGKDECLVATVELIVAAARQALEEVAAPNRPWTAALRDGTTALLELLAEHPAFAHVVLVEALAASGQAAALVESARASLLEFLERGLERAEPGVPGSAARGALAGAEALAIHRVLAGRAGELRALAPDVIYMLAVPCLGIGEAQRLAGGAPRRQHLRAVA